MSRSKGILLILLAGLLLNLFFIMYGTFDKRKFKREGVIVLAQIVNQEPSDKEVLLECRYRFNNNEYNVVYSQRRPHEPGDSLVFLYILPHNPEEWMQLDKYVVPACLTLNDVPASGWTELPLKACDDPRLRL
ncbi:MAG: hypothetical protein KIT80_19645 [Chitinophagaceae bacterium]|nr:hypothetical protein [Chitinophagaceae bacterium]MCW5929143.1 hypothetical protein [Chitinophagaceae bacterium]